MARDEGCWWLRRGGSPIARAPSGLRARSPDQRHRLTPLPAFATLTSSRTATPYSDGFDSVASQLRADAHLKWRSTSTRSSPPPLRHSAQPSDPGTTRPPGPARPRPPRAYITHRFFPCDEPLHSCNQHRSYASFGLERKSRDLRGAIGDDSCGLRA